MMFLNIFGAIMTDEESPPRPKEDSLYFIVCGCASNGKIISI